MNKTPIIIEAYDPDAALYVACARAGSAALVKRDESRNGQVTRFRAPLITAFHPSPVRGGHRFYRVSYSALRNANPFFHLLESVWMLAGENDLAFPQFFNQQYSTYSDDGKTNPGAYGHRWRRHFGRDQLAQAIMELEENPNSRRVVLNMYDPRADGDARLLGGADIPCNTSVYFARDGKQLDMTVCNRSNDLIWGAYGANVVHFSLLHEFVALALRADVGTYYQVSNNAHFYEQRYSAEWRARYAEEYEDGPHISPAGTPVLAHGENWRAWLGEAEGFVAGVQALIADITDTLPPEERNLDPKEVASQTLGWLSLITECGEEMSSEWLRETANRMFGAWVCYYAWRACAEGVAKDRLLREALGFLQATDSDISSDWASAGRAWLLRRVVGKAPSLRIAAQRDLFRQENIG